MPRSKTMKILFFLFLIQTSFAQENLGTFVQELDPESQELIYSELGKRNLDLELGCISYDVIDGNVTMTKAPEEQKEFLLLLGVGVGLIHTYGVHGTVIRKSPEGRLTWFVQAESGHFELGQAPANLSVGFGVFPFKKPTIGLAVNFNKSTYSKNLAAGPELSFRKFFGKNHNISAYSKLGATFYHGERSASGKNYSLHPQLEFGVAMKILNFKK